MKDAAMRIRIEPELRDAFLRACHQRDLPAAQVLRAFMRQFITQHGSTPAQIDLFDGAATN